MPDDIQRTIYKFEIDDSGYIRGVDSMAASTTRLSEAQERTNKSLQTNQAALKSTNDFVVQSKKDLDSYTGTNERYRLQLQKSYNDAIKQQQDLTALVARNQKAYEDATLAAQQFADTTAKATTIQQETGGGRIAPTSTVVPIAQPQFNIPTGLSEIPEAIASTTDEFTALANAIQLSEERLSQLDQSSEEFKVLSPVVAQAKEFLAAYNATLEETGTKTQDTTGKTQRLRTEIFNSTDELTKLAAAGKQNTQEYEDLTAHVAKLTQEYREQRNIIKVLSSETRAIDFGKAAVQSAISGFQAITSAQLLFGNATEETQKKVVQLFAAMQLLSALEQLSTSIKRGSIIATGLQSAAQEVYTIAVGASTGALKAFRLALLGTGIGAALVGIGLLVKAYIDYKNSVRDAEEQQKLLKDILAEANKEAGKQIADLKLFTQTAADANLPLEQRLKAVQELQKEFPDYFGNLTQEAILTGKVGDATDALTKSIEAASKARAAKGKIDVIESQRLDVAQSLEDNAAAVRQNKLDQQAADRKDKRDAEQRGLDQATAIAKKTQLQSERDDLEAKDRALKNQEDFLTKFIGIQNKVPTQPTVTIRNKQFLENAIKELDSQIQFAEIGSQKLRDLIKQRSALQAELDAAFPKKTSTKAVEDVFEQEKASLESKLAELRNSEAATIQKINDEFAAKLVQEQARVAKLLADKKVTPKEEKILLELAVEVNQAGLNKALEDFRKKITEARQKLNDELRSLQEKANTDQLNLIQDEFDRRAALIEANEQKELEDSKANTQKRLDSLEFERLLIGEEEYQKDRQIIILIGEQEVNNIIARAAQQRQDLSADVFKKTLDAYNNAVEDINFIQDKRLSEDIQKESDGFLRGEINYEDFQKNLDEINKRHTSIRNKESIDELEKELEIINSRLATIGVTRTSTQPQANTDKEFEDLTERQKKVSAQLANLRKGDAEADAKDRNDLLQKRLKTVNDYTSAISDLSQSVIQFWQAANEAEQKTLDRSIRIQERRVEAAQRIAERGNAQYLKSETDRLTQLQIARENAARRQLAIDAALQGSQILVAITGAISKIATPGIGVAQTIAEIAVIVGALATGYGLVRSLQANQPRLKEGTPYLQREGHPQGIDTIPALLTEGEAVIPAQRNKAYHPTVKAIYDEKIPAKVINEFVKNYSKKDIVTNVINETSDKKISGKTINDVINKKTIVDFISNITKHDRSDIERIVSDKSISLIDNLVNNKIIDASDSSKINSIYNYKFSEDVYNLVNKRNDKEFISSHGIKKYSEVVSSIKMHNGVVNDLINQRLNKVASTKIDLAVSTKDVKRYSEIIDRTINERALPKIKKIDTTISPNYERIKEAAEMKITHDSKVASAITEQNKLILENNDLQQQTLKAMKHLSVSANIDRDGVAIMVNQYIQQMIKDKRV